MADESMIERVARAICVVLARLPPDQEYLAGATQGAGPAATRGQPMWKYYEPAARAAIAAMDRGDGKSGA